jgi:hypothetical protein
MSPQRIVAIAGASFLLCVAPAGAQSDQPTVTMVNNLSIGVTLFVDHQERCSAPAGGRCMTDIDPGVHQLGAVDPDTTRDVRAKSVTVQWGHVYTWTLLP